MPATPVHLIDFEGNRACGIVEYGVATVAAGRVSAAATRICKARAPIPAEESRIHGIGYAATLQEEPFSSEWDRFVALRRSGPLGAHHATVENNLLKAVWSHPPFCPDFLHPPGDVASWGPWVDTHQIYARLYPGLPSHRLEDLVTHFNLTGALQTLAAEHCPPRRRRYHCALYDALAAAVLLLHLESIPVPAPGAVSLPWLLVNSAIAGSDAAQTELFDPPGAG